MVSRRDLTAGLQAAQMAHALHEFLEEHPQQYRTGYNESKHIVLLSVGNEQELVALCDRLKLLGISFSCFNEPDLCNQLTSICVEPTDRATRYLSHLPLALREYDKKQTLS